MAEIQTRSALQPRRHPSLGRLFALGHLPLWTFAAGMILVTFGVLGAIDARVRELSALAGVTAPLRRAIEAAGADIITAWLTALAGLFVFVLLGSLLVAWTHRTLSRRILRIVHTAERIGAGTSEGEIGAEAPDTLGQLELALGKVADTLGQRESLRQAEQARREHLARFQRALAMVETEEDTYRVVRRGLAQTLPDIPAHLLMADSSQAHLRPVVQSVAPAGSGCGVEAPSRCPAVQQGGTLQFEDSEAIDACPRLAGRTEPCSASCMPVTVMGRAVGVLHVTQARGRRLDPTAISSLESLVGAFGVRAGLLRTLETTQLQAETDTLTGLMNRRSFEAKAAKLLAMAPRACVAMADLDHFKKLNDTFGHAAGDRALRNFAHVLRATMRPSDLVGRWGGEEFVVALGDCSADEAASALDRVRHALAASLADGANPACTVSFGVAEFPRNGFDLEALMQQADAALYQAKTAGRDRVAIAGRAEGPPAAK